MTKTNDIYKTLTDDEEFIVRLEPGRVLAEKFELLELLGSGGMGVVWKARDRVADRTVALKFVPSEIKRYEAEMKRVRTTFAKVHALHHQSICPLHSLESDVYLGYYLVMKYLDGETLDHFMLRHDPKRKGMPVEAALELLMPVASALDYAHQNDVIHRDIKPSNIFLVQTARRTEVHVIDFGLADEIKSSLSRISQAQFDTSGTRPYMAPEQWRGMNGYKDAARLADECEEQYNILKELREEQELKEQECQEERKRQNKYYRLIQQKDWIDLNPTEDEYKKLAGQLRAMNDYKDTAALAEECEKQYHVLKEQREKQERIEREQQEQYNRLVQEKFGATTEQEYQYLAEQFWAMEGYKNTAKLAEQCDERAHQCREGEERKRKARHRLALSINGVEYAFRWCPAGTFTMGSPTNEAGRSDDETQHKVTLSRGFWLSETPVTQSMWETVMGANPSHFKGSKKLPVESVFWDDCQGYIQKLNTILAGTPGAPSGFKFSLPTESQWEYACRTGATTPFHFGGVLNGDKANCDENYPYATSTKGKYLRRTSEVGSYPANAWGFRDMHGNVWEWCQDWYGDYPSGAVTNPVGSPTGSYRIIRGGSWYSGAHSCRSAYRGNYDPADGSNSIGLRLFLVFVMLDKKSHNKGTKLCSQR